MTRFKFETKKAPIGGPSNTGRIVAIIDPRQWLEMQPEEEVCHRYAVLSYKHDLRFSRDDSIPGLRAGEIDGSYAAPTNSAGTFANPTQVAAHCIKGPNHLVVSLIDMCSRNLITDVWHDGLTKPWDHSPRHLCMGLFAYLNPGARVLIDTPRPTQEAPQPSEWLHHEFQDATRLLYLVAQLEVDFTLRAVRRRAHPKPPSVAWGGFLSCWLLAESLCARLNGNFEFTPKSEKRLDEFVDELLQVIKVAKLIAEGKLRNLSKQQLDGIDLERAIDQLQATCYDVKEYVDIMIPGSATPDASRLVKFFAEKLAESRCYNPGDKVILGTLALYLAVAVAGHKVSPYTAMADYVDHDDPYAFAVAKLVQSPYILNVGISTQQKVHQIRSLRLKSIVHSTKMEPVLLKDLPPAQIPGGYAGHITGSSWKCVTFVNLLSEFGMGREITLGRNLRREWEVDEKTKQQRSVRKDEMRWILRRCCCIPATFICSTRIPIRPDFFEAADANWHDAQVAMSNVSMESGAASELSHKRGLQMYAAIQAARDNLVPIVSETFPAAIHKDMLLVYALDRVDCGSWAYPNYGTSSSQALELFKINDQWTVGHIPGLRVTPKHVVQMAVQLPTPETKTAKVIMFRHVPWEPEVHSPCQPEEFVRAASKRGLVEFSGFTLTRTGLSENLSSFDFTTRSPFHPRLLAGLEQLKTASWEHPWVRYGEIADRSTCIPGNADDPVVALEAVNTMKVGDDSHDDISVYSATEHSDFE